MSHWLHGAVALAVGALALLVLGAVGVGTAPPAQAAAYRYWTSWWGAPGATTWTFASTGPAFHVPKDGAVEGWRFAVSEQAGGQRPADGRSPASVFDELCAGTAPQSGSKRVALLLDSGTDADAPTGQSAPEPRLWGRCVSVAPNATGAAVLAAAGVGVRTDSSGLLCALNGYPRGECAPVVADPTPTRSPTPRPTTPRPTSPRPTPTTSTTTAPPRSSSPAAAPGASSSGAVPSGASAPATAPATPPTTSGPASSAPAATGGTTSSGPGEAPTEDIAAAPIATGAPASAGSDGGGTPWTLLVGLAVVAGLGTAAALRMRGPR